MRKVGLDGNRPVENGVPAWRVYPPDFMADTGTAYVRIYFLLDQWSSPAESGWLQVYDTIVNGLKGKGIEVYGLIGHESVLDSPGDNFRNARENRAANAWIDRYVENFVTVVEHFRDRVQIFESFDEPNDWHGGNKAWIHPYWLAKMLERIYRAVKLERGFTDVTLVSGPLLAHDLGGAENMTSMATRYLRDTYQAGKEKLGWEDVRSSSGSYPLDGIGYHLYVREGPESRPADIQRTHKKYLDAISGIVRQQDVAEKKIYVSEFGWSSASGEGFQAESLKAGLESLREDRRVALAIYFCTQDFPGREYGLLRMNGEKKPAYNAFLEQARLDREAVVVAVEPTLEEKIVQLQKEAQELRQQLAAQGKAAQLGEEAQGLRQQAATSEQRMAQLQRQVDTLRQQLVVATTTTPVSTQPVTTPVSPTVTPPVVTPPPVTPPAITRPPIEDVTTRLRRHPVKRFDRRTLDQIKYLVIQQSVLPGDFPPEKIADYLVEKRQWPGIGYHFYITSDGTIYQTNDLETVCYFAGSNVQQNPLGVCICFAGDFINEVPTDAQLNSGGRLLAFLMQELRLPMESIRGHKEFVVTLSPGQQWDSGRKWRDMLLARVREAQAGEIEDEDARTKALVAAREIEDAESRAAVLTELAPRLPELLKGEALQEALAAAREIEGADARARALISLAPHLPESLRVEAGREAMVATREIEDAETRAPVLTELAHLLPTLPILLPGGILPGQELPEEVAQALEAQDFARALEIAKAVEDAQSKADAMGEVAQALVRAGEFERALATVREIEVEEYRAQALAKLASYLPEAEREQVLREVLVYDQQALTIARETGNRTSEATTLRSIGAIYRDLSDYEQALAYYQQALAISQELGDQAAIADTLHQLGRIAYDQEDYKEARRLHQQSLQINEDLGNQVGIAHSLHELGWIALDQGDYNEARRSFQQSLDIFEKLGDQLGIARSQRGLGRIAQDRGSYDEAHQLFQKSLTIFERLGAKGDIANTLYSLGRIALEQGELETAYDLFQRSLEIDRELGDQSGIAYSLNSLGQVAHERKDYDEALKLCQQSLMIFGGLENQAGIAWSLYRLGQIALAQGDNDKALDLFQQSLEIFEKLGHKIGIANTLRRLGHIARNRGNSLEARSFFQQSLDIFEQLGFDKDIDRLKREIDELAPLIPPREPVSPVPPETHVPRSFEEVKASLSSTIKARRTSDRLQALEQLDEEIRSPAWDNEQRLQLIELLWEAFTRAKYRYQQVRQEDLGRLWALSEEYGELVRRALQERTDLCDQVLRALDDQDIPPDDRHSLRGLLQELGIEIPTRLALEEGPVAEEERPALEEEEPTVEEERPALEEPAPEELAAKEKEPVPEEEELPEAVLEPLPARIPAAIRERPYLERGADRTTVVVRTTVFQNLAQAVDREQDIHSLDIHLTPSLSTLEAELKREKERGQERAYHVLLKWLEESDGRPQEHYFEGPLQLDVGNEPLGSRYGAALHKALFHPHDPERRDRLLRGEPGRPSLLSGYRRALERSRDEEGLHLQLRIDTQSHELHGYKWEYLWDPEAPSVGAVACNVRTPFARVLHVSSSGDRRPTISRDAPLRILAAMASPADLGGPENDDLRGLAPLDRAEILALPEGLDHVGALVEPLAGDNLLLSPNHCVSLETLRQRLLKARDVDERPVHILHLLCHGLIRPADGRAYLVLHAHGSGLAELVPEESFAEVIGQFLPDLRLVVLASCQTALPTHEQPLQGVARRLVAAGMPAVIAMQDEFHFDAAEYFSQRLYVQLAHHGIIDRAVNAARRELYDKRREHKRDKRPGRINAKQWGVPVLFMRLPDGRLFDLAEGAPALSDPDAETRALPYEEAPGSDPARRAEEMLRTVAGQMGAQLNLAAPALAHTFREAFEAARATPAPALAEERPRLFGQEGQKGLRWALVQAAAEHRRHRARRSVLFLRSLVRAKIAGLVEQERLEALDPVTFRAQIWNGGFASLEGRNARDMVEGGPRGAHLSTGRSLIEANSAKWRTYHRGFESDDGALVRDRDRVGTTGNLTWAERWKGKKRTQLREGQRPDLGDLERLLYGRGDTFAAFRELTGDENHQAMGLDERTASLLLHAVHPDRYVPYHGDLASDVLDMLRLREDPRYDAGFEGYCHLAADLLADDDLGFEDLADVGYFLQRLGEEDERKLTLKEARDYPSDLRVKLQTVNLKHSEVDTGLVIRRGVLEQAVAALNGGQHIILIGPPGTGKTTLAEDLSRRAHDLNCNRGHVLVTATADWTTFDTIGGYMPDESGDQLVFRPGIFLEAIEAQKWLVIDEINRADIDKAFGELFTVLSGQAVTLPYKEGGRPVRILPPGHATSKETRDYAIHPSWRIIGTMNVYDKASLFAMSYAFMRRFAFVDVAVPARDSYRQLIRHFLQSAGLLDEDESGELKEGMPKDLCDLFDRENEENHLMKWRALGPAIALDVVRYLRHRTGGKGENVSRGHLAEALLLYVVPQFDGLEQDPILKIHGQLKDFFPTEELPDECQALLQRIQELFPFIPGEAWAKTGRKKG